MNISRVQGALFTAGVTCASRYFVFRDRWNGRLQRVREGDYRGSDAAAVNIGSGRAALDAMYVQPAAGDPAAAVLICHGIGELVDHWRPVQHLLALQGVASLAFDYSGYGRSKGTARPERCEANALAAHEQLRAIVGETPISLVGFSMGSGVACAVVEALEVRSLVLCAAFTSFRAAVQRIGAPARLAPPVWDNEAALGRCRVPVLLMHGGRDELLPVEMAQRLQRACAAPARVVVWPEMRHDDAYRQPSETYWQAVAKHVTACA